MSNRLIAYRVPPNREHLVQRELREAGIKAYVPRDRSRKRSPFTKMHPTDTVGWVFPERAYNAAFRRHAMVDRGTVSREEIGRLYQSRPKRRALEECPYAVGQSVWRGDVPGTVVAIRGRHCLVETVMLGKQHQVAIHYTQLRPG